MDSEIQFSLILSSTRKHGIGLSGKLPWNLPRELRHFSDTTRKAPRNGTINAIIMGRHTWNSLQKPLTDRINIVLSSTPLDCAPSSVTVEKSLDGALNWLNHPDRKHTLGKIWICGGASVYNEAMRHPACCEIYLTMIEHDFQCDVFWDGVDERYFIEDQSYTREEEENGIRYCMMRYVRL